VLHPYDSVLPTENLIGVDLMALEMEAGVEISEIDLLMGLLRKDGMSSVFQPIVDICRNNVCGYEVLSRGSAPIESPGVFLEIARKNNLTWEVEEACRRAALKNISLQPEISRQKYFINVSPAVFIDPKFPQVFNPEIIGQFNITPSQVVLEITERESIKDYSILESNARAFKSMGFQIAVDDLGAGHSGLRTLTICTPDYLKLDMSLVRDISKDPYKQHMVRFLCDFASQVDSKVIAEGVEEWAELLTLIRLGVRFVQGFLFSRPLRSPAEPDLSTMERLRMAWNDIQYEDNERLEGLASIIIRGRTIVKNSLTCEELHKEMKNDNQLNHLVILDEVGKPLGLVTRQGFFLKTGGAFGYDLFLKKKVDEIAKKDFLLVKYDSSIRNLSKLAMERKSEEQYDPVIIVDHQGYFIGTVTMKQIIARSSELEIDKAMNANPLSGLPGNRHIENWIFQAQRSGEFYSIIYGDLDNFKQYNDKYGFLCGDKLIRATANILREGLHDLPEGSRLGHVGGDDFVCLCPGKVAPEMLDGLCMCFDKLKRKLFTAEDLRSGYYTAHSREGKLEHIPLVTLSLSVLESDKIDRNTHPARIAEIAASLKHKVKQITQKYGRSAFLFERRSYK